MPERAKNTIKTRPQLLTHPGIDRKLLRYQGTGARRHVQAVGFGVEFRESEDLVT